ncbi:hypothetical protein KIW84_050740 [Lathyrus oleraceus]|uniref:Exportin-2 C-terminal domain-containing protein n=1 Tax=Pisum sativum TaxID=3888 RepID=A0A9D4WM36_PEA|nr:hypothetical protein KIW84_050740 [Pisum sativum]
MDCLPYHPPNFLKRKREPSQKTIVQKKKILNLGESSATKNKQVPQTSSSAPSGKISISEDMNSSDSSCLRCLLRPPIPPFYMQIFEILLSPDSWKRASNVPALVRLLQVFLQHHQSNHFVQPGTGQNNLMLPSARPPTLGSLSIRPPIQPVNSTAMNQQMHAPFPQHPVHAGSSTVSHNLQTNNTICSMTAVHPCP